MWQMFYAVKQFPVLHWRKIISINVCRNFCIQYRGRVQDTDFLPKITEAKLRAYDKVHHSYTLFYNAVYNRKIEYGHLFAKSTLYIQLISLVWYSYQHYTADPGTWNLIYQPFYQNYETCGFIVLGLLINISVLIGTRMFAIRIYHDKSSCKAILPGRWPGKVRVIKFSPGSATPILFRNRPIRILSEILFKANNQWMLVMPDCFKTKRVMKNLFSRKCIV